MEVRHLWKSLIVLGIVLAMISFSPSTIIAPSDHLTEGLSYGHLIQCPENPYIVADQRYNNSFSLYFMTPEEGFRLINGTPIENITLTYSLENITEYYGFINLHEPGQYFLFVTASNQSESVFSYIYIFRGIPQVRLLNTGLVTLLLGILIRYYPFSKLVQLYKRYGKGDCDD